MCLGKKSREAKCQSHRLLSVWLTPVDVNPDHRTRGSVCEVTLFLSHCIFCLLWRKVTVSPTEWGLTFHVLKGRIST